MHKGDGGQGVRMGMQGWVQLSKGEYAGTGTQGRVQEGKCRHAHIGLTRLGMRVQRWQLIGGQACKNVLTMIARQGRAGKLAGVGQQA